MAEGDECIPLWGQSLLPAAPFLPGCSTVSEAAAPLQPGYLVKLVPEEAPLEGESLQDIMSDVRQKIMPGTPDKLLTQQHRAMPSRPHLA